MAQLILPYPDFQANTKIISSQVDANNTAITNLLNGNLGPDNLKYPFLATGSTGAEKSGTADATTQGYNSRDLVLRGSGWDGAAAQDRDIILRQIVTSSSAYKLGFYKNEAGVETLLASIDQNGVANIYGSLNVNGTSGSVVVLSTGAAFAFTRNSANYIQATTAGGYLIFDVNGDTANHAFTIGADKSATVAGSLTVNGAGTNSFAGTLLNTQTGNGAAYFRANVNGAVIGWLNSLMRSSAHRFLLGFDSGTVDDVVFKVATGAAGSEVITEAFRILNATGITKFSKEVQITGADVRCTTSAKGIIVRTPDDLNYYRIRVDNTGAVVTELA